MTASGTYWTAGATAFTNDTYFAGADGGGSIDLGGTRVLWLYGDSFIRTAPGQHRTSSVFVRNSVSLQTGSYDLSTCTMTFFTGGGGLGSTTPNSFFPERAVDGAPCWNWPAGGIMLDTVLLIFLDRYQNNPSAPAGFQFTFAGSDCVLIDNPQDSPSAWNLNYIPTPSNLINTGAGTFLDPGDGWIYGANYGGVGLPNNVYLQRWDRNQMKRGIITNSQFWRGSKFGWTYEFPNALPRGKIYTAGFIAGANGGTLGQINGLWTLIETPGFGGANPLSYSSAATMFGPFAVLNGSNAFFTPFGSDPNLTLSVGNYLTYAGGAHPEQTWSGKGATDILCTYAVNGGGSNSAFTDETIYFVRPVKATGLT